MVFMNLFRKKKASTKFLFQEKSHCWNNRLIQQNKQ